LLSNFFNREKHLAAIRGGTLAPAHFSAAVFRAIGVDNKTVDEFLAMLAREHVK
jgi:hypothetical protein